LVGLSGNAIAAALKTQELKAVTSVALCLEGVQGLPAQLLDALSESKALNEVYFLQKTR